MCSHHRLGRPDVLAPLCGTFGSGNWPHGPEGAGVPACTFLTATSLLLSPGHLPPPQRCGLSDRPNRWCSLVASLLLLD